MSQASQELRVGVRAALINGTKDMTQGGAAIESFATNAGLPLPSGSNATGVLATIVVDGAYLAFQKSYSAIQAHNAAAKVDADQFEIEYQTGTASFFVADKESERKQGGSQRYFDFIMALFQGEERNKNSLLCRYAGIHFTPNKTITERGILSNTEISGTIYSVLSFAEVVFANGHEYARAEDPLLDEARDNSDDFIIAKLKMTLRAIHDHKPSMTTFTEAATRRKSLVLFWVIAVANLVISLQHPPDVTDKDAIGLCEKVKQLIDQILLADTTLQPYTYVTNTMYCHELFYQFLFLAKQEVEALQFGYKSKVLNQLSLDGVIVQSYLILQETNTLWFQLLYLDHPNAGPENLVYLVRCLAVALENDATNAVKENTPSFLTALPQIFKAAKVNLPPEFPRENATVIDVIGVITGLPVEHMEEVLKQISQDYSEIKTYLQELDLHFIKPLSKEVQASTPHNAAQAFLLNLIALSIESRHPRQRNTRNATMHKQCTAFNTLQLPGKEAQATNTWSIWHNFADPVPNTATTTSLPTKTTPPRTQPKRKLHWQTIAKQSEALTAQYVFLDLFRSVCALQELLDTNENILLREDVRALLRKVLASFLESANRRKTAVQQLYNVVNEQDKTNGEHKDQHSNLRRSYILRTTAEGLKLDKYAEALRDQIKTAIDMLDSPDFSAHLQQKLEEEVDNVVYASHEQFLVDRDTLLRALALPSVPQQLIQPIAVLRETANNLVIPVSTINANSVQEEQHKVEQHRIPSVTPSPIIPPSPANSNENLRLQLILRILRAVSIFLLVTGILTLLAITWGAAYLPIIASMSAQQMMTGCVMGGVSAVVGGVSLALSYFFKPAAPNQTTPAVNTVPAATPV